ncbi:MAG TPA: hypothetical protein VK654_15550 [Nitrospirota bacterium]|nr:hypothetical protein [Nitrospirota bacterium]
MKWSNKNIPVVLCWYLCLLLISCASTGGTNNDPLKNTKKLAAEGHVSLYKNGAFQVPNTSISLIPPGPSTLQLVRELSGIRARQSFEEAVTRAAESVYIVSEGTKLTYRWANNIRTGSNEAADKIRKSSRENSMLLVYRSTDLGKSIVGKSWDLSGTVLASRGKAGDAIVRASREAGARTSESGSEQGVRLAQGSLKTAKGMSDRSRERSAGALEYAKDSFVNGYIAVPARLKKRAAAVGDSLKDAKFGSIAVSENERRREWSQRSVELVTDTVKGYGSGVSESFGKAGQELDGAYRTTGLSFAIVKSLRWVLQGILWDATVKPVTKMTAASLGYIGVNAVAFPSLVMIREGAATTEVAVEVSWNTAAATYDLVAPTGIAAVAGVYGLLDFTGSHTAAATAAAAGNVLGYGGAGLSKTAGVAVIGAGYAAGKTVEYIGVPLASAGIALGGGTIGTAVGGVGAITGGAVRVAGEAGSTGTQAFGNVIAGTTLVGGTAVSAAGGAAYGVYELSKAVVVPSGYELSSGIVLSYGTLSHLGAQSILAVSDCAYMVLSLEGPRWVLYAVRGKRENNDPTAGAVVDLKKMQEAGEEIVNLPVTDKEMSAVVESVYDTLPTVESGSTGTSERP